MKIDSPCRNCPFRTIDCHGKCEAYKHFLKECEEQREKIRQGKSNDYKSVLWTNSLRKRLKGRQAKIK